jgi:hypothetical protein
MVCVSLNNVQMDSNKKEILESLESHKGIVTTACKSIGLARSTYYSWLENDPAFKIAVDEIQEVAIDFVESKLMEKINGVSTFTAQGDIYELPPSDTAIIFFLKTKGKSRGYQESIINKNVNYNAEISEDKIKEIASKLDADY